MTDIVAERQRCGNGHISWLSCGSPPWEFIRDMGKALYEQANGDSKALLDTYARFQPASLGIVKNKQVCLGMKDHFRQTGENPLALEVSSDCWMWYTHHLLAVSIAANSLGRKLPSREGTADLVRMGGLSANVAYINYNVWDHGSQTFVFSDALAAKLMLTDVGHVKVKDFHMPFPAFVLQVPPSLGCLVNQTTGEHSIDSILVVDGYGGAEGGQRKVEFLFTGMENEKSVMMGDDAVVFSNLWCRDEEALLSDVIVREESLVPDDAELARFSGTSGAEGLSNLMMWVCAMILYITDFPDDLVRKEDPEVDRLKKKIPELKGKAKRNAKRKLRALQSASSPFYVGTKVAIDPRLEKAAAQTGRGKGESPSVASYVRGHRKLQAHGPGRTLRKPIWVDPYWRNLEQDKGSSKTYSVQ